MADDLNPTLRTELLAMKALIEPKLRGHHNRVGNSITAELQAKVNERIAFLDGYLQLIAQELQRLDSANAGMADLESHGWPDLPKGKLLGSLKQELDEDLADDKADADDFEAEPVVSSAATTFPASTLKPPA